MKIKRYARRAILAIVFCFAALVVGAGPIARFLIVRAEPLSGDSLVVLAGSSVYDERIEHAITLFKQGRARTIVLTNDGVRGGWSGRRQRNIRPIERGSDMLAGAGVHADNLILLMGRVRGTYDEALAVRDTARTRGLKTVLVVTSPYHSRRALWTFRRVLSGDGVRVGIDPVQPGQLSPRPETWWLSRRGWYSVALEYPKLAYYLLKHG